MKEFDEFEIERSGSEEAVAKTGLCPLMKTNCHGPLCMWWVKDWNEGSRQLRADCAVSLIAIGINDENLQRITGAKDKEI